MLSNCIYFNSCIKNDNKWMVKFIMRNHILHYGLSTNSGSLLSSNSKQPISNKVPNIFDKLEFLHEFQFYITV